MDLITASMNDLRKRSKELLGKIVIKSSEVKGLMIDIENLEYEHTELCAELMRRVDIGDTAR